MHISKDLILVSGSPGLNVNQKVDISVLGYGESLVLPCHRNYEIKKSNLQCNYE